jgi:elongation factor P
MKLKNFTNGKVIEDRVRAGSEIEIITTESRTAQYLYRDGDNYYFMDSESFDQVALSASSIDERMKFMKENETVSLMVRDNGEILDVEIPLFVTLRVTVAETAARGDTVTNVLKSVTLETGATVHVPAFVKEGDMVKVDTRTGEYIERVRE